MSVPSTEVMNTCTYEFLLCSGHVEDTLGMQQRTKLIQILLSYFLHYSRVENKQNEVNGTEVC